MSSGIGEDSVASSAAVSSTTSKIVQWQNWRLAVKLTAVALVPVTFALLLGVHHIQGQTQQAAELTRLDGVVSTASAMRDAATQIQEERTHVAVALGEGIRSPSILQERFAATDEAVESSLTALRAHTAADPAIRTTSEHVRSQLATLDDLRRQVLDASVIMETAIDSYSEIVSSLLAVDQALIDETTSTRLGDTATTLHELTHIGEELHLQHAWVLVGIQQNEFTTRVTTELESSETRRASLEEEFRAAASPQQRADYDRLNRERGHHNRETSLQMALAHGLNRDDEAAPTPFPIPTAVWNNQSQHTIASLESLQQQLEEDQHRTAFILTENASDLAGLESVILVSGLLIAGAVFILIARQLLQSLDTLRLSALNTANIKLPRAVSTIRAGNGSRLTVERVPVDTSEEIGQVARAFDDVHKQAIILASEQAELRNSYSDSFVNIARRSQSLLERQLRLFEQLEHDEEDPDQLATLFQLDHLSTRMRRNNENLMVLSGADLARRFTHPVAPADLVRAAVSEIEHYPRVVVQPMPDCKIVGYASNDLVRLLAELLDNAANFSSPDTSVTVSGNQKSDGSISIEIVDRGIGMTRAEIASVNERLRIDREMESSTSRRMGLFVVARLANRHGVTVVLAQASDAVGVQVTIDVRAEQILDGATDYQRAVNGRTQKRIPPHLSELEDTRAEKYVRHTGPENSESPAAEPVHNGVHISWPANEHDLNSTTDPNSQLGAPSQDGHDVSQREWQHRQYVAPTEHPDDTNSASAHEPSRQTNQVQDPVAHETGTTNTETPCTPIFDTLASAWFQDTQASDSAAHSKRNSSVRWPAKADDSKGTFLPLEQDQHIPPEQHSQGTDQLDPAEPEDWGTACWSFQLDPDSIPTEQVRPEEPTKYTDTGLPVRIPRANLIVANTQDFTDLEETPRRDASMTRRRLANFQQGLHTGRQKNPENQAPDEASTLPATQEDTETSAEWSFDSDSAANRADMALNHGIDEYTSAGLPRRTPRAQLAPGAAKSPTPSETSPNRDAPQVRQRLSSYQQGARKGKHSVPEPADEAVDES